MAGKGDSRRPFDYQKWSDGYDAAFRKTGRVVGSCGHWLTDIEGTGYPMRMKGMDREGNRAVVFQSVCAKCFDEYHKAGEIITEKEAEEYLKVK